MIATTEAFALALAAALAPRSGAAVIVDPREPPEPGETLPDLFVTTYSVAPAPGCGFGVLEHWRLAHDPPMTLRGRHFLTIAQAQEALRRGW